MKKAKKIKVGIEKVNKVYHIADVHIRNLKRHKEYRDVFSHLYGYILSTMEENDIIYIAGDIVHAKTDMSPEVVDLTQEFFTRLADLLPTIVISSKFLLLFLLLCYFYSVSILFIFHLFSHAGSADS